MLTACVRSARCSQHPTNGILVCMVNHTETYTSMYGIPLHTETYRNVSQSVSQSVLKNSLPPPDPPYPIRTRCYRQLRKDIYD